MGPVRLALSIVFASLFAPGLHAGACGPDTQRAAGLHAQAPPAARPTTRLFVLTDIENEPDDAQSMVRLLTYANHFDIEGLVATTSVHQPDETAAWRIREIVDAYAQVRDNLERHEAGYPSAE
jgi:hypothetical protein